MEAEFCLMCGDDATKMVAENWAKYVPKILKHGGIEEGTNESAMLKAIHADNGQEFSSPRNCRKVRCCFHNT